MSLVPWFVGVHHIFVIFGKKKKKQKQKQKPL